MEKQGWNVFRSIPRNSDNFEPRWTLLFAQISKVFMYIFLHALSVGTGIMAKLIILLMTSNMRPTGYFTPCIISGPTNSLTPQKQQVLPGTSPSWFYWSLWLAFCVPEILTFCRCLRIVCFKFIPNPATSLLFFAVVVEILHTIGVCVLIFSVLPELDTVRGAMILCATATLPALLSGLTRFAPTDKEESKRLWVMCVLDCFAFVMQASSLWLWPVFDKSMSLRLKLTIPLALLLTSMGWWENYVSRNSRLNWLSWLGRMKDRLQRSRYKISILTSVLKCVVCLFCMIIIGGSKHSTGNLFDLSNPFEIYMNASALNFEQNRIEKSQYANYVVMMLICLIFATFLGYQCAKLACKVKMDWFAYAMPVTSVAPLTVAIVIAFCETRKRHICYFASWIPDKLFWNCDYGSDFLTNLVLDRFGWAWILWLLSYFWVISHIFSQKIGRLNRTDTIFVMPMYNGLMLDNSLSLNRRRMNVLRIKTEALDDEIANRESLGTESTTDQSLAYSMTSLSLANSNADTIPKIYICATMWHENYQEMVQMLKSIFRMDEDQCARKNAQKYLKVIDPDYYELEAHVFFDDAWETNETTGYRVPNSYVQLLISVIDNAASSVHKVEMALKPPVKIDTPYGGRLVWTLPGDNRLFVHLKDKEKIRTKKRWSQVMYMYYLLGHRIMEMISDVARKQLLADNTFLLAIDGDSNFDPPSVQKLVDLMKKRSRLGSACGRIHPIGSGFMVWYQQFEYAIAHWFQKATEHVFGCVLCAPGCFSLFRGSALMDDNVMQKYTKLPTDPRHFVQYDQGEDRWLSTLLLKQGYRIEYAASADADTYAPEGFDEFFNQRRRWTPSSIANTLDLLGDYKRTVQNNDSISTMYVFYQMLVILFSMMGPGIIFTMMIFAQVAAFGKDSNTVLTSNLVPIIVYCLVCFLGSSKIQLLFAKLLSIVYAFVMMAVLVGTGIQITTEGAGSPISMFVFSMAGIFCVAAFFHPKEFTNIFTGAVFFLMIPCTYVLMSLYALINLNVINWGTREAAQKATGGGEASQTVIQKWLKKMSFGNKRLSNDERRGQDPSSRTSAKIFCGCVDLCRCFICPDEQQPRNDERFMWLGERLERIDRKLDRFDSSVSGVAACSVTGEANLINRNVPIGTPELAITAATPSRGSVCRQQKVDIDSPSNMKYRQNKNRRRSRDYAGGTSDDADGEDSDDQFENLEVFELDEYGRPRASIHSDGSNSPKWMRESYLQEAPYDILDEIEHQFWVGLIDVHLKPLPKIAEEELLIAKGLVALRNNVAFGLLLINSLLVLVIYLLQMNKELLSIDWNPGANYTIIKFDDETGKLKKVQEPLKVEPIGFIIIMFLSFILIVQTIGMIRHRWQTFQHVLASTVLACFRRRPSKDREGEELLEENAVEIVKRLQKLGDDEHGEVSRSYGGTKSKRKKIVFKLERARKRKQRVKGLHAAFQKRFFAFNPDKHQGSLKGIPLEKHNALFQSGSAQKAAAAELKKRRDSVLQQPGGSDVELMPVPSSKGRSKNNNKVPFTQLPVDTLPVVQPTKLSFENIASSAEENDKSADERKPKNDNKNVSFKDDLNKVLLERRRKLDM